MPELIYSKRFILFKTFLLIYLWRIWRKSLIIIFSLFHMNPINSLHYINEQYQNLFFNNHEKIIDSFFPPAEPKLKKQKNSNFYHRLDVDDEYCFEQPSELSKKSKKLIKILQKQKLSLEEATASSKPDDLQNEDNSKQPHFSDDISSISYVCQQNTPLDSAWSKLMKQSQSEVLSQGQKLRFQSEEGSEQQYPLQEPKQNEEDQQNDCEYASGQLTDAIKSNFESQKNQTPPLIQLPGQYPYRYKSTSLSFKTLNNYITNYLKKKPAGIIIHPQYSTIIEDCSQLAVQGKTLRLQIHSSNTIERRKKLEIISRNSTRENENFLKQVFGDRSRLDSHGENKIQNVIDPREENHANYLEKKQQFIMGKKNLN